MTDWERSGAPRTDSGPAVFLQVAAGMVLTFVLHAVVGLLLFGLAATVESARDSLPNTVVQSVPMFWIFWLGGLSCAQLAYLLPAGIASWFVRRPLALGIAIGAGITILLQGSCYALFLGGGLMVH